MLLACVDFGLACAVFVLPFLMGGRQALGQFAVVVLAVLISVAWTARQTLLRQAAWRHTGAQWLLLVAVLLVAFQLVALPEKWLTRLSPATLQMLPLWAGSDDSLGMWSQISLVPDATREGLVQLLAYAAIFLVTIQRIS